MEFNIRYVQPIVWNDEAFANLVLPADRKILLQSLVEAHNGDLSFDDFVTNKGRGLVINLFGPPGVGKTLSAEATSEHVRKPLYVVGAGDLGTHASALDQSLNRVFDIATSWKAIVLIDEVCISLLVCYAHRLTPPLRRTCSSSRGLCTTWGGMRWSQSCKSALRFPS